MDDYCKKREIGFEEMKENSGMWRFDWKEEFLC